MTAEAPNPVDKIIETVRPREVSGTWTSSHYDFQKHLSIVILLERHKNGHDYRFVFDHFDDLVIFDNSSSATSMECIQIKSKGTGPWTLKDLTDSDSQLTPRTIFSKMYYNFDQIGPAVKTLGFATNAIFSLRLKSGRMSGVTHQEIRCDQLHSDVLKKLNDKLDEEFLLPRVCLLQNTYLRYFGVPLLEQADTVKGKLNSYLEELCGGGPVSSTALYRALYEEVSKKSRVGNRYVTVSEFYQEKTLDRATVAKLISRATTSVMIERSWPLLQQEMAGSASTTRELIQLRSACTQYAVNRAVGVSRAVRLARLCDKAIREHPEIECLETILERVEELKAYLPAECLSDYHSLEVRSALAVHVLEDFNALPAGVWSTPVTASPERGK